MRTLAKGSLRAQEAGLNVDALAGTVVTGLIALGVILVVVAGVVVFTMRSRSRKRGRHINNPAEDG